MKNGVEKLLPADCWHLKDGREKDDAVVDSLVELGVVQAVFVGESVVTLAILVAVTRCLVDCSVGRCKTTCHIVD